MSDVEAFLLSFGRACDIAAIPAAERDAAQAAVSQIFTFCRPTLERADTAGPYFAGHNTQHPVRLARLLTQLLEKAIDGTPRLTVDMLVLLFAALVLHDIGMAIESASTKDLPLEEVWLGHKVRSEHDLRSRRFIEEQLIGKAGAFPHWESFWAAYNAKVKGPTPAGDSALWLVARICQAHGDAADGWLSSAALGQYLPTKDVSSTITFSTKWGGAWERVMRQSVESASALLSLLDLCEISGERFSSLPDALLKRSLPDAEENSRRSFVHWLGHLVTRIDFDRNTVRIEVTHSTPHGFRYRIPAVIGPAGDLRQWGRTERLLELLSQTGIPLQHIEIVAGAEDENDWQRAREEAKRVVSILTQRDASPVLNANLGLAAERDELDAAFIYPMWWMAFASKVAEDFSEADPDRAHYDLDLPIRIRNVGLLIEDLYSLSEPLPEKIHLLASPSDGSPEYFVSNSLLVAMKIARTVMERHGEYSIRLAMKGNSLHRQLREGDAPANAIVLVHAMPTRISEYQQMVRHLSAANRSDCLLIFFGGRELVDKLKETDIAVECRSHTRPDRIESLVHCIAELNDTGTRVCVVPTEVAAKSPDSNGRDPAGALFRLCERGTGVDVLQKQMAPDLTEPGRGLGFILFVTLYDLLGLASSGVALAALQRHYENINIRLPGRLGLPRFDDVLSTFTNSKLLQLVSSHVTERLPGEGVRKLVATGGGSTAGLLLQLATFFEIESTGEVYNVHSELFRQGVLPLQPTEALCDAIFSPTVPLEQRTLVAFGLADHFGASQGEALLRLTSQISRRIGTYGDENSVIAFQTAYRICRTLRANSALVANAETILSLGNKSINLGLLEAIASETAAERDGATRNTIFQAEESAIVKRLCDFFVTSLAHSNPTKDVAAPMAYDILYQYKLADGVEECDGLTSIGKAEGWDRAAAYFRDRGPRSDVPKPALPIWRRLRRSFVRVLLATPTELRREALPEVVISRAIGGR